MNAQGTKITIGMLLVILAAVGVGVYMLYANLSAHIADLEDTLSQKEHELKQAQAVNDGLQELVVSEQDRLRSLGQQVGDINGTLEDFKKLADLEPELLQKYSKVYFLNENYVPANLSPIKKHFLYDEDKPQKVDARVWPFLDRLLEDAKINGIDLYIASAYRSFGEQSALKTGYTVTYGSGANAFSADQGYSEHQLGTTVDFITTGINGSLDGFETTDAYEWLKHNAYKYGFILSYPEGNQYYVFEPWHWRFVGKELAGDLNRQNKNFYDLSQRDIDEYLLRIFD